MLMKRPAAATALAVPQATKRAKKEGAVSLTLNARLTAVGFYQQLGFKTFGKEFPSSTTGVIHIAMSREL